MFERKFAAGEEIFSPAELVAAEEGSPPGWKPAKRRVSYGHVSWGGRSKNRSFCALGF